MYEHEYASATRCALSVTDLNVAIDRWDDHPPGWDDYPTPIVLLNGPTSNLRSFEVWKIAPPFQHVFFGHNQSKNIRGLTSVTHKSWVVDGIRFKVILKGLAWTWKPYLRAMRTQLATPNPHVVKRQPIREQKLPPWMMKMWMSTLPNMISRAWWATSCIWVAPCIWLECKGSWWRGSRWSIVKTYQLHHVFQCSFISQALQGLGNATFFFPACKICRVL